MQYINQHLSASLWTPDQLALSAWFDALDASTITTGSQSSVSQWSDKSGHTRHATQSTGANQPTYNPNGLGTALPSIDFDGVNDILKTPNLGISGAAPRTLAYVYLRPAGATSTAILQFGAGSSLQAFGRDLWQALLYHWVSDLSMASPAADVAHIEVLQSTGTVSTGFTDGSQVAQGNYTLNTPNSPLQIGGRTAPEFSTARYGTIRFGAILALPSVLSTADRQRLEGWLAWRFGAVVRLPSSHPYKSAPPTI